VKPIAASDTVAFVTTPKDPAKSKEPANRRKVTTQSLRKMKERGEVIAALTAYDHTLALPVASISVDSTKTRVPLPTRASIALPRSVAAATVDSPAQPGRQLP